MAQFSGGFELVKRHSELYDLLFERELSLNNQESAQRQLLATANSLSFGQNSGYRNHGNSNSREENRNRGN